MHPRNLAERRALADRRRATDEALAAWSAGGAIERRQGARRALDSARVHHWINRYNEARAAHSAHTE